MRISEYREASMQAAVIALEILREQGSTSMNDLIREIDKRSNGRARPAAWGSIWRLSDAGRVKVSSGVVELVT